MDSITFKCRACQTTYSVKPALAGRTAECTKCGQRMQVPYKSPVVKLNEEMMSDDDLVEDDAPAPERRAKAGSGQRAPVAAARFVDDDSAGSADAPADLSALSGGRTFDEYDHLRKPGKNKGPKASDEPFLVVPSVVNDIWAPLGLCVVFYGLSAMQVWNYVTASYGFGAGMVIAALAALGIYAAVIPLTVRVIEAAADSFDFKPTNALWLQVLGAMSMPIFGVLLGMFGSGLSGAIAFGVVGMCFALAALAIFFQTAPAKAFQSATMATLGFGVSTAITALLVWGISVFFIPRWGMNLPWVKPPTPEEVALANGQGKKPPAPSAAAVAMAATTSANASKTPGAASSVSRLSAADAAAVPGSPTSRPDVKIAGKLFDMSDVTDDGLGGTAAPAAKSAAANAQAQLAGGPGAVVTPGAKMPVSAALAVPAASAGSAFDAARGDKPIKPLPDIAKQREWVITVVSVGQPQVDQEEIAALERQLQQLKPKAESARAEATRLEGDTVTVSDRDTFGRIHYSKRQANSARTIADARTAAKSAERDVAEVQQKLKKSEQDQRNFANQRLISAILDDGGTAVEVLAIAPSLVKSCDDMQPGSRWTVKGAGRVDGEKVSVRPTAFAAAPAERAAAPVPAGVAEAVTPAVAKPTTGSATPLTSPRVAAPPKPAVRE